MSTNGSCSNKLGAKKLYQVCRPTQSLGHADGLHLVNRFERRFTHVFLLRGVGKSLYWVYVISASTTASRERSAEVYGTPFAPFCTSFRSSSQSSN